MIDYNVQLLLLIFGKLIIRIIDYNNNDLICIVNRKIIIEFGNVIESIRNIKEHYLCGL